MATVKRWTDAEVDSLQQAFSQKVGRSHEVGLYRDVEFWQRLTDCVNAEGGNGRTVGSVKSKVSQLGRAKQSIEIRPPCDVKRPTRIKDVEVIEIYKLMKLAHFFLGFSFDSRIKGRFLFRRGCEEIKERMRKSGIKMSLQDIRTGLNLGWRQTVLVEGCQLGGLWILDIQGSPRNPYCASVMIQTCTYSGFLAFLTMCRNNRILERAEHQTRKTGNETAPGDTVDAAKRVRKAP